MKLRNYQEDLSNKATVLLQKYKFVILAMAVRTGKTITAFETIKKFGVKKVLFLTKKKAIYSIEKDYIYYKSDFDITIINYESLHKIKGDFDIIILDEIHSLGTFPKPNNKYKAIKKRFGGLPMIGLSGTISPESFSQLFHQFHISNHGVWGKYTNFYRWANDFVKIGIIYTSYGQSKDYSNANYEKIIKDVGHLILTFTQEEANFTTTITEKVLYVKMKPFTYSLIKKLEKDRVIEGTKETIVADTAVSLQQKIHQISSGTCITESGKAIILDNSKAIFIKNHFKDKQIGIFYNFKAELNMLKEVFGHMITDDLQEFNTTNKHFCTQIIKGREGISLSKADCLVFFNIAFSALSYFQARDRLSTIDRKNNTIYWIFSEGGIENYIYKQVQQKKNFTNKIFKKELNNLIK